MSLFERAQGSASPHTAPTEGRKVAAEKTTLGKEKHVTGVIIIISIKMLVFTVGSHITISKS